MILCLDLDDTIANTSAVIIKYARKFNNENFGNNEIEIKNSIDQYYFARKFNWNREHLISFFDNCYPQYLKNIKVLPKARLYLKKIKNLNIKIYIVTSRRLSKNGDVLKITEKWLKNNDISYDKLFIDIKNKEDLVKSVNADFFVDDSIENCLKVKNMNPDIKVFVMNTDYNKNVNTNINRISSFKQLYEYLRE